LQGSHFFAGRTFEIHRKPEREENDASDAGRNVLAYLEPLFVSKLFYLDVVGFYLSHDHGACRRGICLSNLPDEIWPNMNRAHALMFLGRADEARALYLRYRGMKVGEKSWEAVILEDFADLRKAGLTHPLMDEIEKKFTENG
jgi:hypothetical protein